MVKATQILLLIFFGVITSQYSHNSFAPQITYVTALFDLKCPYVLSDRSFDGYLIQMEKLLRTKSNLIIFGEVTLKNFVWQHRQPHNTLFVDMTIEDIYQTWYAPKIATLRNQRLTWPFFSNKASWQNFVKDYNVIINSKMHIMFQAAKINPFHADYLYWIDAGFFHLVEYEQNFIQKTQTQYFDFVQGIWTHHTYGYQNNRFSGYKTNPSQTYLDRTVNTPQQQIISNIFGGILQLVFDSTSAYYNLLNIHLHNNDLNSQQALWTLMQIRFPYIYNNNFISHLNNFTNIINIRQAQMKNQRAQRYFLLKFISGENMITINKNVVTKLGFNHNDFTNEPHKLKNAQSIYDTERINTLRNKLNFHKQALFKRKILIVLLILFGIIVTIYARKTINQSFVYQQINKKADVKNVEDKNQINNHQNYYALPNR